MTRLRTNGQKAPKNRGIQHLFPTSLPEIRRESQG